MDKATRILNMLTLLLNGHVVTQEDLDLYKCQQKSIQRDINTINTFFMKVIFGEAIILKLSIIIN